MFDGDTLQERQGSFELSLDGESFVRCGDGIYYTQWPNLGSLSVDGDALSSRRSYTINGMTKGSQLHCMEDDIVIVTGCPTMIIYNIANNSSTFCVEKGMYRVSGLEECGVLLSKEKAAWLQRFIFPKSLEDIRHEGSQIIDCASSPKFMVTCHINEKSSVQFFCLITRAVLGEVSKKMRLDLPKSIPVSKLELQDSRLLVIGTNDDDSWLLLVYSLDEKKVMFSGSLKGKPLEIHWVGNNIFAVFKVCDDDELTENLEVMAFDIGKRLR